MENIDAQVIEILNNAGIFGPDSKELEKHESHLARYFERKYKRLEANPVTLASLGISTDKGPMMEETEELMDHHYDERPEFFASFLDKHYRAYSMAYYGDTPEEIRQSKATLEEAQYAKFSLIAKRAQIEGNERILNIGCGFGSLETFLLQEYPGLEIVGITPSKVQANYLRDKMKDSADLLNNRKFNLFEGTFEALGNQKNYTHKFDLIISIGTMEHSLNMRFIMKLIDSLLVKKGRTFHHFITSQFPIPQFLDPDKTQIGKYFPGGRVWPQNEFSRHQQHFELEGHWFVNGLNYWKTLDEWHRRYWKNIAPLYSTVFDTQEIKHWNEYFSLCKAVFAPMDGKLYGNSHYLFRKTT